MLERENKVLVEKMRRFEESMGLSIGGNQNNGSSRTNKKVT